MSESWRRALGARRLLVSGFGKWGGGVYDLTSGQPVALDDMPTSGLAVGGGRLWRVLRAPGEQTSACELLAYDARGVVTYQRLDTVRDPHDLCWHDGAVHVVSSWDGTVWRLGGGVPDDRFPAGASAGARGGVADDRGTGAGGASGGAVADDRFPAGASAGAGSGIGAGAGWGDATPRPVWRGGTVPDSWHVNSLVVVDGRLHVCAFGRFDGHKSWKLDTTDSPGTPEDEARRRAGFVHDIARGEDVLRGLAHPHAPRRVADRWYVCESSRGALTECSADGQVRRRALIRRFSRGLAVIDRWALVGGNAHRDATDDRAEIVVVDLRRFEIVGRIAMPCLEVYDIVAVPPELARGVALGFGGNPARAVEQHRATAREASQQSAPDEARVRLVTPRTAARLAAAGQRLAAEKAARCSVRGILPAQMTVGEIRTLTVTVTNRSGTPLTTVPPGPIRLGARWLPLDRPPARPAATSGDRTPDLATSPTNSRHPTDPATSPTNGRHHPTDPGTAASPRGVDRPAQIRNPLAPLPHVLPHDEQAEVEILLVAPDHPGRYELRVALHQPTVGWFGIRLHRTITVASTSPDAPLPLQPSPATEAPQRDAQARHSTAPTS